MFPTFFIIPKIVCSESFVFFLLWYTYLLFRLTYHEEFLNYWTKKIQEKAASSIYRNTSYTQRKWNSIVCWLFGFCRSVWSGFVTAVAISSPCLNTHAFLNPNWCPWKKKLSWVLPLCQQQQTNPLAHWSLGSMLGGRGVAAPLSGWVCTAGGSISAGSVRDSLVLDVQEEEVEEDKWQAGEASSSPSLTTRQKNMSSPKTEKSEYYLEFINWPCWDT